MTSSLRRGALLGAAVVSLRSQLVSAQASCGTFDNMKTSDKPHVANHPVEDADIVIGTEADWGNYNFIKDGVLGGFDIELTNHLCTLANKKCAIVTAAWQSVWPSSWPYFDISENDKTYPGRASNSAWFHCSVGTRNIIARQQSTAFTDPYTNPADDKAGFVVKDGDKDTFPANAAGKKVGILKSQAFTNYFKSKMGTTFDVAASDLVTYDTASAQWTALENGDVHAIYTGSSEATKYLETATGYSFIHPEGGWSGGVAYGCRPEFGDVVATLNAALVEFKSKPEYATLCDKYKIACDTAASPTTFVNAKTAASPSTADHPTTRADVVIGTEADWGDYNWIKDGVLGGFDIELTKEVCATANLKCAIVTVPWKSVWPKKYDEFGVTNAKQAQKAYPGLGLNQNWFHCSVGTRNTVDRQQSVAFTSPYTDPTLDKAGFLVKSANANAFPADAAGKKIGIRSAQGFTGYFLSENGAAFNPASTEQMDSDDALKTAIEADSIDAIYTGTSEANSFMAANSGYSFVHDKAGWSKGVAFGCKPEFGNIVKKLDDALKSFKATTAYTALIAKHSINGASAASQTFENSKSSNAANANHPDGLAKIVIGTEADWGDYNGIKDGKLTGFDIELTEKVCEHAGVKCAVVTVPWQSVWPSMFPDYDLTANPKTYPGVGMNNAWFHCSVGTRNMIARQQSTAFTDPYTDMSVDTAGFVTSSSDFPADAADKKVGILKSQAYTVYYISQQGLKFKSASLTQMDDAADVWKALKDGDLDAVYTGKSEADTWMAANSGFQYLHGEAGWSQGVAYGCRPEFGEQLSLLNDGLRKFKKTPEYTALCAKYPTISCDTAEKQFTNAATDASPATATHPTTKADIVFATAADSKYATVEDGVLKGFDVELISRVCSKINKACSLITVPPKSIWPVTYITAASKSYPGVGFNDKWFHCAPMKHTARRQQSVAFSNPYATSADSMAEGMAFGCRPEFGATVKLLNDGLTSLKAASAEWKELCDKYPDVECDCMGDDTSTGTNTTVTSGGITTTTAESNSDVSGAVPVSIGSILAASILLPALVVLLY